MTKGQLRDDLEDIQQKVLAAQNTLDSNAQVAVKGLKDVINLTKSIKDLDENNEKIRETAQGMLKALKTVQVELPKAYQTAINKIYDVIAKNYWG